MLALTWAPWALVGLLAVATVGTYAWRFHRRLSLDSKRFEETASNAPKPMGQFPYVDPNLCIGCGTCTQVCPEGDVLGLVGGQATVINGARCIGIAACEAACPVGAIEVGMGDIRGRADLPVLSEELETSLPGVFVVGELGGLSLVRNAIEQGNRCVRAIAERLQNEADSPSVQGSGESSSFDADLVIMGIGPSGMSAALTARELNVRCLVLEQEPDLGGTIFQYPRRKIVHTQPVLLPLHGWLKKPETTKEELIELFTSLHLEHQLDIRFSEKVAGFTCDPDGITVQSTSKSFRTRFLVIAIGRRGTPRKLGVPGEQQAKVLYQVRDAELYQGKRILCVGGGDSAIEAAMGLAAQPGNKVTLSYRNGAFARIKSKNLAQIEQHQQDKKVEAIFQSNVQTIGKTSVLIEDPTGHRELDNDLVFIFAGGIPPYPLLKAAGVQFADELAMQDGLMAQSP